jgi:hypothetical protein
MAIKRIITRDADNALDAIIDLAERVDGIDNRDYVAALEHAAPQATQEARNALVSNYRASGVETRTGKLLRAIKGSILEVVVNKAGGAYVKVSMPSGKDKNFYIAANSVNYGRVNSKDFDVKEERIQRSIAGPYEKVGIRKAGAKRRQKLKASIHNKKGGRLVNAAQGLSYDAKAVGKTKAGSAKVDTTLGSATVTKAFDFFKLKQSQKLKISRILFKGARAYLEEKLSR